jgi:hypothetical protein
VFVCCGFLSFSLVFCLFGGRLEASLYIHFIRGWVKSRRHSSAPRKDERGEEAEKVRHSSLGGGRAGVGLTSVAECFSRGWLCGVFLEVSWGVTSGLT